jgi:hypothetical protein
MRIGDDRRRITEHINVCRSNRPVSLHWTASWFIVYCLDIKDHNILHVLARASWFRKTLSGVEVDSNCIGVNIRKLDLRSTLSTNLTADQGLLLYRSGAPVDLPIFAFGRRSMGGLWTLLCVFSWDFVHRIERSAAPLIWHRFEDITPMARELKYPGNNREAKSDSTPILGRLLLCAWCWGNYLDCQDAALHRTSKLYTISRTILSFQWLCNTSPDSFTWLDGI